MDLSALETQLELGSSAGAPRPWAVLAPPSPPRRAKAKVHKKQRFGKKAARRAARASAAADPDAVARLHAGRDPSVSSLDPEVEEGNVEFKLMISTSNPIRYEQLVTQMKYRLAEGRGEAFYYIGVEDDGYPCGLDPQQLDASLATLRRMAAALGARAGLVERLRGAFGREAALVHVERNTREEVACIDLRVAVAGSTDSGKSTLTAVLTHGADGRPLLDNGRGRARMAVLRHKHEIQSGRTSSISQALLGYDADGQVLNYAGVAPPTPAEVCSAAARAVTFLDLGGHHSFLKTTLFGLTSMLPATLLVSHN
ncbi:GTP-binding protein 2 [Monoraphidium neglectum]|uniref:GTP-binding protein 2 n=1 Tax=Monoraphidium neglectum TaxID=145388 RepID=A0A0D2ND94_9CHLO|nr:GTP-binding protein 2 [Monoraphidium neglectum]KIZ03296.1 GTP-binding protein 2 [Monoraphidium neglectum]|eukprot:XP_013902315.1 GTP-binding protein 2 [Monoraphidium neglectum]